MYKLTKLKNNLRVVTYNMPHVHSVTSCLLLDVGSRYEAQKQNGISHFLEHMFFKGSKKYPQAADVAKTIESLGGYTNAATSQEFTYFYSFLPRRHYKAGIGFLAEIIKNSLFEESSIQKEKGVILQEINMYLDDPARHVYDLTASLMWPGHALGRDVAGDKKSVSFFTRQDLVDYLKKFYQPRNMVFCVAGKVKHAIIVKEVEKYLGELKNTTKTGFEEVTQKQKKPRVLIDKKKTDQAHLCLAFEALPYNHPDQAALVVLNSILGEGMSSRLFLNIREDKGLAYSIYSFAEKFRDTGMLGVGAGADLDKKEELIKAILYELNNLKKNMVEKHEMDKAKEFIKGRLELQIDESDKMAAWYGIQFLFYKKIKTPQERMRQIERIGPGDIQRLARKIFRPGKANLAIIGNYQQREERNFYNLLKKI